MAPVGSLRQLLAAASCLAVLSLPALISGQGSVQQKGNLLQLCNKNGTTLSPGLGDCVLNEDVVALSDINTYTVQVQPGSSFILLLQAKALSGDVDLRLTGPPGSGLNMLSNDRLGEQVLWLTARNVSDLSASGPVTLTVQVIGYAYWSSYQLTLQTQSSVRLVPEELTALADLRDAYCHFNDTTMPIMCDVLARATAPNHAIDEDICSQPPSMCDSMGHLVKLVFMASDLGGNMPVDTLPMSLTSLQSLSTLDMSMNYVYLNFNTVVDRVLRMPSLQRLLIIQGRVNGMLNCSLFTHPNITELYINNGNIMSGTLPSCIFSSPVLKALALSGNMFEGAIPPLPPKSPLTVLDLSGSSSSSGSQSGALAGTVPPSIANAPSLLTLDVSNNKLTGTLPDMTTTLVTFGASNNRLTGPLPASLGRTPNLRTLRVGGNRFSGTVPSGLIYAAPLETLNLTSNQLVGTVNFLWANQQLKQFDVSNNLLSGEMPYYLGQLPQLRILNLGGNGMTGDLSKFNFPTSSQVVYFNVSGNSLAGTLPQSLQNLLVFSFVPPPTCTDASTDPAAPPVGSAFAVGGTNLNIEFPLWLLDALGNLYNLTQGSIACINIDLYSGNNVVRCPAAPPPASTFKQYYFKVQSTFNLQCRDSSGNMVPLTAALGYDAIAQGSPPPAKNSGAIAGIVIGVLAGIAALGGGIYWLYRTGKFSFLRSSQSARKVPLTFNTAYDPSDVSNQDMFSTYQNPLAAGHLTQRRADAPAEGSHQPF